jgi:hypothetical protein
MADPTMAIRENHQQDHHSNEIESAATPDPRMRTLTLLTSAHAAIRFSQSYSKLLRTSHPKRNSTIEFSPGPRQLHHGYDPSFTRIRYALATGFREATTQIAVIERRRIGETNITLFGQIQIVNKLVRIYAVRIS